MSEVSAGAGPDQGDRGIRGHHYRVNALLDAFVGRRQAIGLGSSVYAFARWFPCRMLLVRAYQSATARTFSMPRTVNCLRSQFRHRA
jgi:hypothetical protein